MSQRPDTLKVLNRAVAIAAEQNGKLQSAVDASLEAVEHNTTLTSDDIGAYKDAVRTAQKLITAFTRVTEISLPAIKMSPAKRGRPPKMRAAEDKASKKPGLPRKPKAAKVAVKAAATVVAAPKKRGRPAKAVVAVAVTAPTEAPKKRGRPKKVTVEGNGHAVAPAETVAVAPKKRGRPKKVVVTEASADANSLN